MAQRKLSCAGHVRLGRTPERGMFILAGPIPPPARLPDARTHARAHAAKRPSAANAPQLGEACARAQGIGIPARSHTPGSVQRGARNTVRVVSSSPRTRIWAWWVPNREPGAGHPRLGRVVPGHGATCAMSLPPYGGCGEGALGTPPTCPFASAQHKAGGGGQGYEAAGCRPDWPGQSASNARNQREQRRIK